VTLKCLTFGCNSKGNVAFHVCLVQCDEDQYEDGEHLVTARQQAKRDGWRGDLVSLSEHEGFPWLFAHFDWSKATLVRS
jgi:hypothetical protein